MAKVPFTQHLDLSRFDAAGLTYRICQTEFPLQPHTGETRRALKEKSLFFRHVPDERLTHYVDATLNENSVALSMVTQASTLELNGTSYPIDLMVWGSIGIPVQSMRLALADATKSRTADATKTIANRLRHLRGVSVSVPGELSLAEHVQVCADAISYGDALSTAAYFAYQHNAVLHLNADQMYPWYIYDTYVLPANGLDDVVPVLENTAIPWYTLAATVDLAGNPVFDSNNDLVFSQPPTMEDDRSGARAGERDQRRAQRPDSGGREVDVQPGHRGEQRDDDGVHGIVSAAGEDRGYVGGGVAAWEYLQRGRVYMQRSQL